MAMAYRPYHLLLVRKKVSSYKFWAARVMDANGLTDQAFSTAFCFNNWAFNFGFSLYKNKHEERKQIHSEELCIKIMAFDVEFKLHFLEIKKRYTMFRVERDELNRSI